MYKYTYLRILKLKKTKFYSRLKMLRVKIKINLPRYAIEKNERRSFCTQQHYANDIQLRIVIQQTIRKCFVNRVSVTRECL